MLELLHSKKSRLGAYSSASSWLSACRSNRPVVEQNRTCSASVGHSRLFTRGRARGAGRITALKYAVLTFCLSTSSETPLVCPALLCSQELCAFPPCPPLQVVKVWKQTPARPTCLLDEGQVPRATSTTCCRCTCFFHTVNREIRIKLGNLRHVHPTTPSEWS